MKENKYDDEIFFEKYSQMERSKRGLEAAGEWHTLKEVLPNFTGKKVLDLGCGYGWHCRYAAENGAAEVIGVDISNKMIEKAKTMTKSNIITYRCQALEDIDFARDSFDIILSSLVLHYVEDYRGLVKQCYTLLQKGGTFIFNVEHPVFTAEGHENYLYDQEGKIICYPVNNYFYEGQRQTDFLGEKVIKYHRTLTTYLDELLQNGFLLERILEPQPSAEMMKKIPAMVDEMRRPMMLIVKASKK